MTSTEENRCTSRTTSLRSSHRSSTTRSSTDLESLRLSLTSEADPTARPASTWNPICSIQSSSFAFDCDELLLDDNDSVDEPEATAGERRGLDPPSEDLDRRQCALLVPWEELQGDNNNVDLTKKAADGSSATQALSSSCDDSDEEDVEPCEEHYRVPPAKDEEELDRRDFNQNAIVCRTDPPPAASKDKSSNRHREQLVQRINAQLALVPSSKYNGYSHHFITVEEQHRFVLLYNFLKRNLRSKIVVYFSTIQSTQYHARLLHRLQFNVKIVHGRQSKERFLDTYLAFSKQEHGGILCLPDSNDGISSGNDGSRAVDNIGIPPTTSYILQYEPPRDPTEYIFRVGRISSEQKECTGGNGNRNNIRSALIFVTPVQQSPLLKYFKAANLKYSEYEMHNLSNVQRHYEKLVRKEKDLTSLGREAYHSFLLNYASHYYRDVYDIHRIDRNAVAKSFGFTKAPTRRGGDTVGWIERSSAEDYETRRIAAAAVVGEEEKDKNHRLLQWKPNRKEGGDSWMNREDRLWRHADRHSHLMRKERIRC